MSPPHVSTFQRFSAQIPNHLEASIAFGLFMEAEKMWSDQARNPTDTKYRNYQEAVTDHDIGIYAQRARGFLNNFGSAAVAGKRAEFLKESLERYESAASRGHSGFRWWGIFEAWAGSFMWAAALIVFSVMLKYGTIDPFEIYNKVAGH
jgi:hypothetical protein